jgi:hypothetical protein
MDRQTQQTELALWRWEHEEQSLAMRPVVVIHPPPSRKTGWLLAASLLVGTALAGQLAWLAWQWKQESVAAQQQALAEQRARESRWAEQQQRQAAEMRDLLRELERARQQNETAVSALVEVASAAVERQKAEAVARAQRSAAAAASAAAASNNAAPVAASNGTAPAEAPAKPALETAEASERVKMEFRDDETGEPAPKKKRNPVARVLTSSIFIDSAVLTTSLLVPPSIPLTLAQSRLGRKLTGRVLKKTGTDKTVGGKIAKDVGDMPITQRRRR